MPVMQWQLYKYLAAQLKLQLRSRPAAAAAPAAAKRQLLQRVRQKRRLLT
jgi:hypothetical protein